MEREEAHLCGATIYLADMDIDMEREVSTLHMHSGKETTAYALTPTMLKHLHELLMESIESYEQTYGPILAHATQSEHMPNLTPDTTRQIQEVVNDAQHVLEQIEETMKH